MAIMEQGFDFSQVASADQRDIVELAQRIEAFQQGREDVDRFRLYRLTRGVYGQRQEGVQMFRTKIPFGKLQAEQLRRIAAVAERYASGNLHLTTRQNIQLHYVKLAHAPAVWTELAQVGVTAREACGNTVRNITASPHAGIDPQEPFDVSPYVQATFAYFLRNPICQDMGRKVKIAFSSSSLDSAFTYFHDFGFIPQLREEAGEWRRGFKVLVGGGLGAVSMVAQTVSDFMPEEEIIPFMEAGLRVFDRYGEREKRMKARLKFLLQKIGLPAFLELVEQERLALKNQKVWVDRTLVEEVPSLPLAPIPPTVPIDRGAYEQWRTTNVYAQKQTGFFAIQIRVPQGDLSAQRARDLAALVKDYAADDLRITINQGLLIKFVPEAALPLWYNALYAMGLAQPGFDTTVDITACPGTDTCALGVTNSTALARVLEDLIEREYPQLISEQAFKIKISGCMNSCGQHMAANFGLHGSSIKNGALVVPAMQVVLGGGIAPDGRGFIADKIVKLPSKRIPQALRLILDDYMAQAAPGEYYNDYFLRQGNRYFYTLLKPLADLGSLAPEDHFDWGQHSPYQQEIGVGECAGVMLDVVGTILQDAQNKVKDSLAAQQTEDWADAIYHAYSAQVIAAKALLLSQDHKCNTQAGILADFQTHFVVAGPFADWVDFPHQVLAINREEPSANFATTYGQAAAAFVEKAITWRTQQLQAAAGQDKIVIGAYYKA